MVKRNDLVGAYLDERARLKGLSDTEVRDRRAKLQAKIESLKREYIQNLKASVTAGHMSATDAAAELTAFERGQAVVAGKVGDRVRRGPIQKNPVEPHGRRAPRRLPVRRGWLRNGNPPGDLSTVRRCGAKNRRHTPCRAPAMKNGRCKFHGGLSTGPRTPEGLERSLYGAETWSRRQDCTREPHHRGDRGAGHDPRPTQARTTDVSGRVA